MPDSDFPENERPSAIVFVVDGLRAPSIGCYGNTTFATESFDELAANSLLFEWVFADTTCSESAVRSILHRTHPLCPKQEVHLAERVAQSGGYSILFTDDSGLAESEIGAAFDRAILIEQPAEAKTASNPGSTHLANFFAQLLETTLTLEPGSLLWIHSRGLYGVWDAPKSYRLMHTAPEDPEPPEFASAPKKSIVDREESADELLGFQQAYSAQVTLLDEMLGLYLAQARDIVASALFCLTSIRGFPLGEHLEIGESENLYNENLHVPLLVSFPGNPDPSFRSRNLIQPRLVYDFVCDWFGGGEPTKSLQLVTESLPNAETDFSISTSAQAKSLCTHSWKLIRTEEQLELFVKPDDRWEINDISSRCVEIAAQMNRLLSESESLLGDGIDQLNSVHLPIVVSARLK